MKRNRRAENALRLATANSDSFLNTALLHVRGVGHRALADFSALGWIEPEGPQVELQQLYRITDGGRAALAAALEGAQRKRRGRLLLR